MDETWHPRLPWCDDEHIQTCSVRLPSGRRIHCARSVTALQWRDAHAYRAYHVSVTGRIGRTIGGAEDELGLRCILVGLAYPGGSDG